MSNTDIFQAIAQNFNPDKTEFKVSEVVRELSGLFTESDIYKAIRSGTKSKRGYYNLEAILTPFRHPNMNHQSDVTPIAKAVAVVPKSLSGNSLIGVPDKVSSYVPWGNFQDIHTIVSRKIFYPTFICGLSGNGKTFMVEQAAAKANRNLVRIQITPETDETDLIGGFQLIDGDTIFVKGPVVQAMEQGAICLLDEIDRGTNKLMCLQSILEGGSVLLKKTGEVIKPKEGFTIIATANTKGQGSDDGRFVAASILDDAFLERFTITIEQQFPTAAIEKRIVRNHMKLYDAIDEDFLDKLIIWSEAIRKTFEDGGIDELISTRRLCHIVHTFAIFADRKKAIELCISRFDADSREAFLDLYTKIDVQPETSPDDTINELVESMYNPEASTSANVPF